MVSLLVVVLLTTTQKCVLASSEGGLEPKTFGCLPCPCCLQLGRQDCRTRPAGSRDCRNCCRRGSLPAPPHLPRANIYVQVQHNALERVSRRIRSGREPLGTSLLADLNSPKCKIRGVYVEVTVVRLSDIRNQRDFLRLGRRRQGECAERREPGRIGQRAGGADNRVPRNTQARGLAGRPA